MLCRYLIKPRCLRRVVVDRIDNIKYTESELRNKGISWLKMYVANCFEEMKKIAKGDKIMSEAVEMVRAFYNDPVIRNYKTNEEMEREQELEDTKELALKEGIEKGMEKGIEQNKIEIAKNMLKEKEPLEKIMMYTSLSEEEIKEIVI